MNIRKAHCIGFWFGFSQFMISCVRSVLFYASAQFVYHFGSSESGEGVYISQFAMMFGAFSAGNA